MATGGSPVACGGQRQASRPSPRNIAGGSAQKNVKPSGLVKFRSDVAGGSGLVPFRSILRHHRAIGSTVPVRLLYSARSPAEVIYRPELTAVAADGAVDIRYTLTREQPEGWQGYGRRIDQELLGEVAWPRRERPLVYACGPTAFVETAASALVALGHEPGRIRIERFGPTGG